MDGKGKQLRVLMVKKEFGVGDEGFSNDDEQQQLMGYDYNYESSKKKKVMIDSAAAVAANSGGGVIRKVCSGGGGGGMRLCQVEKCGADLFGAKAYHRRHKVCELHAKSQVVLVEGVRQRFCQQCSRFHELSEFDDTKRSCRRRLAGHNERRRKNAAESHQAEGSSGRKGSSSHESNDMVCGGQFDDRERIKITIQENATYKHFQIR